MDKPSGSVPQQVQQSAREPKPQANGLSDELNGLSDELRGLLRRAGIISNKKSKRGNAPSKVVNQNSSSITDPAQKQPTEDYLTDNKLHDTDRRGRTCADDRIEEGGRHLQRRIRTRHCSLRRSRKQTAHN
jgi:hypothetical protein